MISKWWQRLWCLHTIRSTGEQRPGRKFPWYGLLREYEAKCIYCDKAWWTNSERPPRIISWEPPRIKSMFGYDNDQISPPVLFDYQERWQDYKRN